MTGYAPLAMNQPQDSMVVWNHDYMQKHAGQLQGYVKVRVDVHVALGLAQQTPYPSGVKLAVMKQVAGSREITLRQLLIILGWSAHKSQMQGVYR